MRFQVPQFIEIEDKLIANLTFKQFIYLAGGAGMGFVFYKLLPSIFGLIALVLITVLALSLAFYRFNDKPFEDLLESAVKFYLNKKLYVWKKEDKIEIVTNQQSKTSTNDIYVPKLSDSKLKELSWSLDIKQQDNTNKKDLSNKL